MADQVKDKSANPMRKVKIEKLVLNICIGDGADRLTRAATVLKELTDQEPVFSKARYTVRTFGIRRNQKISTHVTVRGDKAEKIVNLGLRCKDYEILAKNFSDSGNFGFGIEEHIDMGVKYDPAVGIYGMDFYVVLSRAGTRVSKKKRKRGKVGKTQRVSRADAMKWVQSTFQTAIL